MTSARDEARWMSVWIAPARARRSGRARWCQRLGRLVLARGEERRSVEQRERAGTTRSEARLGPAPSPRASRRPPRRRARTARPRCGWRPRRERALRRGVRRRSRAGPRRRPRRRSRRRAPAWRQRREVAHGSGASAGAGTARARLPCCSASMTARSHASSAIAALSPDARRAHDAPERGARPARGRRRRARSRSSRCRASGSTLALGMDDAVVLVGAHDMDDRVGLADVREELVAEPLALVRAAHEPRDVVEVDRVVDDLRRAERLGDRCRAARRARGRRRRSARSS